MMEGGGGRALRVAPPCVGFEPQEWRRSVCKNCFKTRDRHRQNAVSGPDEQPEVTSPPAGDADQSPAPERIAGFETGEAEIEGSGGVNSEQKRKSETIEKDPSSQNNSSIKTGQLKPLLLYFTDPETQDPSSSDPEPGRGESPEDTTGTLTVPRQRGFVGQVSRSLDDGRSGRRRGMDGGTGGNGDMDDDGSLEGNSNLVVSRLRIKISDLDERCERLEREKAAVADLLAAKKVEAEETKERYQEKVKDLEDEAQRLKTEKTRLVDRLRLPEKERSSLLVHENEMSELRRKLEEEESHSADIDEENADLKQELKDLHLEMEELHDQFREDEAIEFRELQKELESTAKSCRILQFKLRKAERRIEQLGAEKIQAEEKLRQVENRFQHADERQHLLELEEELRATKELNAKLHDQMETVEEKRARYEQELDRVNDILTESENRRQGLQLELERLREQINGTMQLETTGKFASGATLQLPKVTGTLVRHGSQEVDVAQVMKDLSDSLERENDLKEQLKFAEEEAVVIRKKIGDLEDENESLNLQLHKVSMAKTTLLTKFSSSSASKKSSSASSSDVKEPEVITEREHELRLQMELAESEVNVLRRKLNEMEASYDVLLGEVKLMKVRVDGKDAGSAGRSAPEDDGKSYEEKVQELARDIERLKWKLMEKDKDADKARSGGGGKTSLQKSRSLEEQTSKDATYYGGGGGSGSGGQQLDFRRQMETVQQEAKILREKMVDLERDNERLSAENKRLQILSAGGRGGIGGGGRSDVAEDLARKNAELSERLKALEAENTGLRDSVGQLDERTSRLSKEVVRAKFSGQSLSESSPEWRELRTQIQGLEDECRALRRKVVDLEAGNAKMKTELEKQRRQGPAEKRRKELEAQTKEELKDRVVELETETGGLSAMLKNRQEDNERLEEEITESREMMNRMFESFGRRESELRDDVNTLQHKNGMLSDLLDLVTERAESTQKELDRHRKEAVGGGRATTSAGSDAVNGCDGGQRRIEALERLLAEETRKVLTVEKKLKMSDIAVSEIKDDSKLRQHEKEILLQELALCQKQLIAANDQITDLKNRLLTMKESQEDIKEDFAKVSKELEKARMGVGQQSVTLKGKPEREPASWRWEKQEMERQLKEHKKKLDDVFSEMKRHQLKWKAAGEDIERENQIKEELEKKINKLKEEGDSYRKEADDMKKKVEELTEALKKKERQWEKEKTLLDAEKVAAENDARQKDDLLRSKDALILQKNDLINEKDRALGDRDDALQQKDALVQQKDAELEFKDRDVKVKADEIRQFRTELGELRVHLAEKEERMRQLDDHVRRRDDRLKEKDDILQQINRKLVEKGNQVSDMDKTIRQVIRKLQARDCDLGMCNAELRRVQTELKTAQERIAELRAKLELTESEAWKQTTELRNSLAKLESQLETSAEEKRRLAEELAETVERMQLYDQKWKAENDRIHLELKQALEKLHVQELTATMNQTEAFKTMMREKEGLIADKFRLNDKVNSLEKKVELTSGQWTKEKEELQKLLGEKAKQLEELKAKGMPKTSTRPSTLSIYPPSTESSFDVDSSSAAAAANDVISGLRARLEQQATVWSAEKATLEEFYEVNSRTLQEAIGQLRDACQALRQENDGQLQLLQSSRRALADLRNRYDLGVASWNEERERLLALAGQVDHYNRQASELERSLETVRGQLLKSEAKCREAENRLMVEENAWKTEKAALEARKISEEDKTPATRVSEFRARFEKFGSSRSKKGGSFEEEGKRSDRDAQEICRELQKQLNELENQRERERASLVEKMEKQRSDSDRELHQLRARNSVLEKKAKELTQLQRSVVDIQYRLVEDRNQWQLERSQLQHRLEEAQQRYIVQKENINQLLAEVKKLRVLASGLAEQKSGGEGAKLRSRSLTPSAEKIRVTALTLYSARNTPTDDKRNSATGVQGNGTKQDENGKRGLDQPIINDLVQAIEETSRLAEDLGRARPVKDPRPPPSPKRSVSGGPDAGTFKRSYSSTEVTPSFTSGLVPATGTTSSIYATIGRGGGGGGRQGQLVRSSSSDEDSGLGIRGGRSSTSSDRPGLPAAAAAAAPPSSSNRGSVYASGTQSAYGSRDPSPDNVGLAAAAVGLRRTSPYPAAPPSMIITPSQTPRREESIDRGGGGDLPLTSDEIQRLYDKLDAIGLQNAADGGGGGGGGDVRRTVPMVKSASIDAVESGFSLVTPAALSKLGPAAASGHYVTTTAAHIIPDVRTSVAATAAAATITSLSGHVTSQAPADKRSASVSPRTARKQFFEDYTSSKPPVAAFPAGTASATTASGGAAAKGVTTTFSVVVGGLPNRYEESSPSSSSSWQQGTDDKAKSSSSSAAASSSSSSSSTFKQFFQNVKDKRKLFGTKKSASVDSSVTHVSIARIGANVLSEPAAPSTYQPPEMTVVPDQKKKQSSSSSFKGGSFEAPSNSSVSGSSKEKEKTPKRW